MAVNNIKYSKAYQEKESIIKTKYSKIMNNKSINCWKFTFMMYKNPFVFNTD